MTTPPIKLSGTTRALLTLAATRQDRLVRPPHLPAGAARQVVRSLLNNGLAEEVPAWVDEASYVWRQADDGAPLMLRATARGLAAIGNAAWIATESHAIAASPDAATAAPRAAPRTRNALRETARAVLAAYQSGIDEPLQTAMDDLRAALTERTPRPVSTGRRQPRTGTKPERVLSRLRRPEGASGPQIAEATGWANHPVRGFLAGLARKGITVTILDRVRQAGPNKQGAKGSYSIYRIAEAH